MKKKRILALLSALCLLAGLTAGCTSKPVQTPVPTPEATPSATATPEPTAKPLAKVENNGGYFLGVDDRVYFRTYDQADFEPALWGEFLEAVLPMADSRLVIYDPEKDAVVASLADGGAGPLWCDGEKLWLTRTDATGRTVYTLDLNGMNPTDVADGWVAGVSDSGKTVAIQGEASGQYISRLALRQEGREVAAAMPGDNESLTFCGFVGEDILYTLRDGQMDTSLWQLKADGTTLKLGELPFMVDTTALPELEQFLTDDRGAYLVFGYYEGTGHFLYDSRCVKVRPGSENSLQVLDVDVMAEEHLPILRLTGPGEVSVVPAQAETMALSEGSYGDLIYFDSPYSALRLVPGFIPSPPYEQEAGLLSQTVQKVGNYAYAIVAWAVASPGDDVGWRQAYRLSDLYYVRMELRDNSPVETIIGDAWVGGGAPADALLSIQFLPSREELSAATGGQILEIENDDGLHEVTERKWVLVTALADNIQVRVEEADMRNSLAARLGWQGEFLTGEVPWNRIMSTGDTVGLHVSAPWNYEARVTARKENSFGDYVFGSDNWLYSFYTEQPTRYVTGVEQPTPQYADEEELWDLLDGAWSYLDPYALETTGILTFDSEKKALRVMDREDDILLTTGHLYTTDQERPDLLCFRSPDGTSLGDYLVDCVVTGTETLVWLRQANNGDGVLTDALPSGGGPQYSFLLRRSRGGECAGAPQLNGTFPGLVWKYDREDYCLWITPTTEYEKDELGQSVWCHAYDHRAVAYPIRSAEAIYILRGAIDADYPMNVYYVTTENGEVTMLESPAYAGY